MDETMSGQSSANAPPGQQGSVDRSQSDHMQDGTYAPERDARRGRGGSQQYEGPGVSSGRSYRGTSQYEDEGNTQHWGRGWGWRGGWSGPYFGDPFLTGLLYGQIFQAERGGNRQYDHSDGRTSTGRFREGHSGRFGQGGSRQHHEHQPQYEPWPETFAHMGYPDVPFHPGLEFQPQQYNPYPPMVYGGMPMRPYGRSGAMQHSGPMSMSPMNQLHFPMDPEEVDCMQALFRKVLHAYEHFKLRGGNPRQLKRIVIDLEQN